GSSCGKRGGRQGKEPGTQRLQDSDCARGGQARDPGCSLTVGRQNDFRGRTLRRYSSGALSTPAVEKLLYRCRARSNSATCQLRSLLVRLYPQLSWTRSPGGGTRQLQIS